MTEPHSSTHVDVLITGCDAQDADAVFHALEAVFPQAAPTSPMPTSPILSSPMSSSPMSGGRSTRATSRPTVWSMSLDPHIHRPGGGPVALRGAVSADVSGCPHEVHEVQDALAEAFLVETRGSVSGDQEVEVSLRLTALAGT